MPSIYQEHQHMRALVHHHVTGHQERANVAIAAKAKRAVAKRRACRRCHAVLLAVITLQVLLLALGALFPGVFGWGLVMTATTVMALVAATAAAVYLRAVWRRG